MNDTVAAAATGTGVLAALVAWLPTVGLLASIVASVLAAVASGYAIAYYRKHRKP